MPTQKPLLSESEEVALLKDLAESLNEANDVSQAMSAILPRLSHVLGLKTAWAFRFDPGRSSFVEVGASGLPPALGKNQAEALKSGWCECQERMIKGRLDSAINIVHCSRLKNAVGDKAGLNFHASIPLKMNGRPLGILNLAAQGTTVFTKPALDLLRAIGYHVAVTIDRASLLGDMRRRNQQLESLAELARTLTAVTDRRQLFSQAIDGFQGHMGFEGVAIYENDRVIHQVRRDAHVESEYSYRDHHSSLLPESERLILHDACSALAVPIPHFPMTLRIESRNSNAFGPIDEEILTAFAWYLTALIEHIDLYQKALDAARWAERRQIAADLHDSVSQHLFSAQLLAHTIRQHRVDFSEEITEIRLNRLQSVIEQSQLEMRRLIETLRPDNIPLPVEMRHRLVRLKDTVGERLTWTIPDAHIILTPRAQDAVLRIVDEALQNAIKHSDSAPIHVTLNQSLQAIQIEVADRGPGFDPAIVPSGYGLNTMRDRASAIGIGFRIISQVNRGTQVALTVPKELTIHE